jgi:membrane protein implicated in regulation of membrane protease activity
MRAARVLLISMAFASILGSAVFQVSRGHGADTYDNVYGMHIQWVSVLILAASLLLAYAAALAIRWWQQRDDRTIDRLRRKTSQPRGREQ